MTSDTGVSIRGSRRIACDEVQQAFAEGPADREAAIGSAEDNRVFAVLLGKAAEE